MSPADLRDRLVAPEIEAALTGCRIGNRVLVFEETRSTNDIAWQMAEANLPEGAVVFAEHQTAGRGQHGRRWESASHKGLWFSVLLRPQISLEKSSQLTGIVARALVKTIDCDASIKLPNDVYLGGKKVAGVLVEGRTVHAGYVAVAGVGLNVNQGPADFPAELRSTAISLAMARGRSVNRQQLAITLLRTFDAAYQRFVSDTTGGGHRERSERSRAVQDSF